MSINDNFAYNFNLFKAGISEISPRYEPPLTKQVEFLCATLHFKKGDIGFGQSVCFILKPHADLCCYCSVCEMHDYVEKQKKIGWSLCRIEEK